MGSTRRVPATLGLPRSRVCAFPVYAAQAPSCSTWSRPCVGCGSSFRVLHKSADSVGPAVCAFPAGAAQAARSWTGALSPGAVRLLPSAGLASVSASAHWVRLVSVLGSWSLAATLPVDFDQPVCSFVGGAVSGAEFAPPPPPSSDGGWASPQPASSSLGLLSSSFVLRMGLQCVRAG